MRYPRGVLREIGPLLFAARGSVERVVAAAHVGRWLLVVMVLSGLSAWVVSRRLDVSIGGGAGERGGPPGEAGPSPSEDDESVATETELAEELAKDTAIAKLKLIAGSVMGVGGRVFLLGLGLYLLGRFVGARPRFVAMATVAAISGLPDAVAWLIRAAHALAPGPIAVAASQAAVGPTLGQLPLGARWAALTGSIDVFFVWSWILLLFGFAAAIGWPKRRAAVALGWATLLFLLIGMAAAPPGGGS